jgi:hypothetical protein
MHGTKQVGWLFQSIATYFPKKTWVFFYFRFYLALGRKTKNYGGCQDKVSLHKVECSPVFITQKMPNVFECIKLIKTCREREYGLSLKNVKNY